VNGLRKICNAPGVDLVPAVAENHMLEKCFGSRLQQVRDERQGGLEELVTVGESAMPVSVGVAESAACSIAEDRRTRPITRIAARTQ
jgi:hypothetical protein